MLSRNTSRPESVGYSKCWAMNSSKHSTLHRLLARIGQSASPLVRRSMGLGCSDCSPSPQRTRPNTKERHKLIEPSF
jgi:hypothetical protein